MERGVKIICLVMLLVLSTSFVYAGTKVTIKTLQYHQVEVIVADGTIADYSKIGNFKGDADQYGDFTFNVDTSKSLINLYVHVKRYSEEIASETFMGEKIGSPINLEVAPEGYELIETPKVTSNKTLINETAENETETNQTLLEDELDNFKLTGYSIGDFFKSKTFYYSVGIIVLLVIIFFVVRFLRRRSSNREPKEIVVRKLSEIQQGKTDDYKSVIDDAEKKIREAQSELGRLRNEEQIRAMKRKIAEDENALIRLRRGGGFS
ncbi:MAG: hypothetical protein WC584_05115 [Candidatus Pacearchaeota archaeon]